METQYVLIKDVCLKETGQQLSIYDVLRKSLLKMTYR